MNDRKTPYEIGFYAYGLGRSWFDCPYDWDTPQEAEWMRGWMAHLGGDQSEEISI